jgi:hypothetical protein
MAEFPAPAEGIVLTHLIVASDIDRSRRPRDPDHAGSFLNIRVADIHAAYQRWRDRGAQFLTARPF